MPDTGLVSQVDRIERMESDVVKARGVVARALYLTRELLQLSLRDIAPSAGITAAQLSNIERGKSWSTSTVRKVARVLDQRSAA